MTEQDAVNKHLAKEISRFYDIFISIIERLDKIERHLCAKCNEEENE